MRELPARVQLFIFSMFIAAAMLSLWLLFSPGWWNPWLFALAGLAAIAQLLKVEGATEKSSYSVAWLIYGYTFVLLGAPAVLFVILVAHLIEAVWHRQSWYLQAFNIAAYAVALCTADLVYQRISGGAQVFSWLNTVGLLCALGSFTLLYHLCLGSLNWLTKSQSFSQTVIFDILTLIIDFTLISLGAAVAYIWRIDPTAVIFGLIPLYLIYSTLKVPALKRQSEVDAKTDLFDSRYFMNALERELDRAARFDRPLTVAMGDLDLLRSINNSYGHLAGDAVLRGIADILRKSFRGYDVVARFGGEEFAILIPETTPQEAYRRVEMVRLAIEAADFQVSTSVAPLKVTISFGIAGREGFDQSANDLIHNADIALYDAKLSGRNLTRIYAKDGQHHLLSFNTSRAWKSEELLSEITLPGASRAVEPDSSGNEIKSESYPSNPLFNRNREPRSWWFIYIFTGFLMLLAIFGMSLIFKLDSSLDWFGLLLFVAIIVITEGLSIDIYYDNSSISTSAAPFIAGVLLFGPLGVLVLGFVRAATSLIKKREPLHQFIFNFSNYMIAGFLCVELMMLVDIPLASWPMFVQILFALIAGEVVFFSVTFLRSALLSLSLDQPLRQVWEEEFRWLWPFYGAFGVVGYALIVGYTFAGIVGVLAVLVPLLTLRYSQVQYIGRTRVMVQRLRSNNEVLETQSEEISTLNDELLLSLAHSIDLRDPYTLGHSQQVAKYTVMIAKELGLPPEKIEQIRKGSLLHDIGKLGVPDSILKKPGRLTADEYRAIQEHPLLGAQMLETSRTLRDLIPMVRHHHERFDGSGYPDQLIGHAIPLEARILAVADSVEAMASDRPYRRGLNQQEILAELNRCSGSQFDPRIVKLFTSLVQSKGKDLVVNSAQKVELRDKQQIGLTINVGVIEMSSAELDST